MTNDDFPIVIHLYTVFSPQLYVDGIANNKQSKSIFYCESKIEGL
jgi:hypothetical protein